MGIFNYEELEECSHRQLLELYCHAVLASWKWFTADEIAEKGPGVLSYVILTADDDPCAVTLYDGIDANAPVIATLRTTETQSRPFSFHDHLYFKHGLYVNIDGDTLGILIVWHPLPHGVPGG